MNTDKILAESIAKDYAPKDNSKIVALKKLDNRAKLPAIEEFSFMQAKQFTVGFSRYSNTSAASSSRNGRRISLVVSIIFVSPFLQHPDIPLRVVDAQIAMP